MVKAKLKTWKDNFKKPEQETQSEPQKRPGICDKCDSGRFTLFIENHGLFRRCKVCNDVLEV